jgi:class 3 adenylate cyclase
MAAGETPAARKLATVMFADLVGSTELAGSQDPERTRALLEQFYDAMAAEVDRAGGTLEKFAGDAVMAVFGAPLALEDHAERAIHAALAMQRRLSDEFGDRLALRIGVNSGEVVTGRAREGSSFVTGDAVNVAARLEQAADPGVILIGERTAKLARGAFELGPAQVVDAKGKPGGVECREVVRALSLMRPRGLAGVATAFVGRREQLEQLQAAYRQVVSNEAPHLVVTTGDAGVGKTRLLREFWAWLAEQEPQPLQRTGRCLSYGHGITYWPLGEILREHFGLLENEPAGALTGRLADRPWLGVTVGLAPPEPVHPLTARDRLHDAWTEFAGDLIRERPAVFLVEDVHWAEPDLFDLIESLIAQSNGPLLVVATARPEVLEQRPAWGGNRPDRTHIAVEALTADGTAELVRELLAVDLPTPTRDLIVNRAEGNPLFVEELIGAMIDSGILVRTEVGWSVGEAPAAFEVPDTVQAVLAARIDMLPDAERTALQAASVIGRVFWSGPVYELANHAPRLEVLEERDFIYRRAGSSLTGEREYVIKHALTREVAYESLPKARRAHLHAAFADWLERTAKEPNEHAALLAHHYYEAVRPEDADLAWPGQEEQRGRLSERAVFWSEQAAAAAVDRYEIDDALALLRNALQLEPDPAREGQIWYAIGHASALKYDGEGFSEAMEQAIDLGAPPDKAYTELAFEGVRRAAMWRKSPDRELIVSWITRAIDETEPTSALRAKALIAKAYWESDGAAAATALEIARRLGDDDLVVSALGGQLIPTQGKDRDLALSLVARRLELLPRVHDPDARADVAMMGNVAYRDFGDIEKAEALLPLIDATSDGLTPHHRIHGVGALVQHEAACANWDALRRLTLRIVEAVEANRDTPCVLNASSLLHCALAHELHGDADTARRLEADAAEIDMQGYDHFMAVPHIALALARNDRDDVARQLDALDWEMFDQYTPWMFRATIFDALVELGRHEMIEPLTSNFLEHRTYLQPFALRALGQVRGDPKLVERAAALLSEMGLAWHEQQTLARLAEMQQR